MVQARDRRADLLEAARTVMAERGLVASTTREIAKRAGVAEGTIYNHFEDKYDLCLCVVRERFPLSEMLSALPDKPGMRPVRDVLVDVARSALRTFAESIPMFSGIIGHPDLAALHRRTQPGGQSAVERLAAWIEAEQCRGTVGRDAQAPMLARLVLATAFHEVYMNLLKGTAGPPAGFVRELVDTVMKAAGRPRIRTRKGLS